MLTLNLKESLDSNLHSLVHLQNPRKNNLINVNIMVFFMTHTVIGVYKRQTCLHQRFHLSLPISQSLVCANCAIIAHFIIYKWHEDDLSRVSDSAAAGKMLAQRPFTSLAALCSSSSPERCLMQWVRVEVGSVQKLHDASHYFTPIAFKRTKHAFGGCKKPEAGKST